MAKKNINFEFEEFSEILVMGNNSNI